jgi:hypothetical protein
VCARRAAAAQLAVVVSAIVLALQRVRAQIHLRKHAAAHLHNERMLWMGYISLGLLVADALRGGSSASTLLEIGSISSKQAREREGEREAGEKRVEALGSVERATARPRGAWRVAACVCVRMTTPMRPCVRTCSGL